MIIYLVLFLLFSFSSHFCSPNSFTFTLQILFDVVLHLLLYLVFVLLYLLSFYYSLFAFSLVPKMLEKDQQFHFFFSRPIWKRVLISLLFFKDDYFFKETCFNFYLVAVLICHLYFMVYRGAHIVFGTLWRCLFWPTLLRVTLNVARSEAWVAPETLCSPRWCVGVFSTFKDYY